MTELEQLLRDSFARTAEPGDPAGVAEAIRARVAAGETGTAPSGFGGSGLLRWLPWIGVIVVAAVVGGVVGFTGLFGAASPAAATALTVSVSHAVPASLCPGGGSFVQLTPGERVLAIQRSSDSAWLAVRDPYDLGTTVWVRRSAVELDHSASPSTLPVGACPTPTISVTPAPVAEAPAPEGSTAPNSPSKPAPAPAPPADTTPPTVAVPTFPGYPQNCQLTVRTTASDNVGVTSVTIQWTGALNGNGSMQPSAGAWQIVIPDPTQAGGPITVKVTAHDAAGNSSVTQQASTTLQCLI